MECSKRYSFEEHRSKLVKFGGASAPPSTYLSTALLCVYVCIYVCVCMYVCCVCMRMWCVCMGGWVGATTALHTHAPQSSNEPVR